MTKARYAPSTLSPGRASVPGLSHDSDCTTCPVAIRPTRLGTHNGNPAYFTEAQTGVEIIASRGTWERFRWLGYSPNLRVYFQRQEERQEVQIDVTRAGRLKPTRFELCRLLAVIRDVDAEALGGEAPTARGRRTHVKNDNPFDLTDENLVWLPAGRTRATNFVLTDVRRRWKIAATGRCPHETLRKRRHKAKLVRQRKMLGK